MEHDVRDRLTRRVVLQRHRRLMVIGRLHRVRVRGYFSKRLSADQQSSTRCFFVCRFSIAYGGNLTVSIGPRQAIAVHTGALGSGARTPTAQQIPIMFSETATTTFGEVSVLRRLRCLPNYLFAR